MPSRRGSRQSSGEEELTITVFRAELTKLKDELRTEIIAGLNEMIRKELTELNDRIGKQDEEITFLKKCLVESERQRLHASRQEVASNVIISGLPEGESETDEELCDKVESIFKALNVEDVDVDDCKLSRVGRPNGHRAVKIVTPSHAKRNLLLSRARTLRYHADLRRVYMNADRCFLDRKEAARLRQRARIWTQDHPDDQVRLVRGKLTVNGSEIDKEEPLRHLFPRH